MGETAPSLHKVGFKKLKKNDYGTIDNWADNPKKGKKGGKPPKASRGKSVNSTVRSSIDPSKTNKFSKSKR